MERQTVLVTSAGGDIGQGITKALLAANYPLNIIACDMDPYAFARQVVKRFFVIPPVADRGAYETRIRRIVEEEKVRYLFPVSDEEIDFFETERRSFETAGVKLFINEPGIVKTFSDKYLTVEFLKQNGLPYPKTFLLELYRGELPFPVIVKQRRGCGGKGLLVVQDDEELAFYRCRRKDMIVQEMLGTADQEYTVGIFSTGKDIFSIAFRRQLGYGGISKITQLVYDDVLSALAKSVARAASLVGPLNMQVRLTARGYIPFEINPRISGTVYIRARLGFEDVRWWIDLTEGREVSYRPRYRKVVVVKGITEAVFDTEP